jgi:hypothetical protein
MKGAPLSSLLANIRLGQYRFAETNDLAYLSVTNEKKFFRIDLSKEIVVGVKSIDSQDI